VGGRVLGKAGGPTGTSWAGSGLAPTSGARLLGGTGQWTLAQDLAVLPSASPRPGTVTAATMLTPRTALFLTLLLAGGSLSQRARGPPRPASPISTIQPKANFDAQQFAGTWFLVAVASSCRFLQEQGHRAEATLLRVAAQGAAVAVSTFQKLDGICWQVRQLYSDTGVPGRFLLQGEARASGAGVQG